MSVAPGGGGGYLVYLSYGNVPFFRVSFSPFFLEQGIKRRQIFWSRCQNVSEEEILLQQANFWSSFCVFEYTFQRLSLEQGVI